MYIYVYICIYIDICIYIYIHRYMYGLFSHGGREKYPPAALSWILAVPSLIYIHIHIHTYSKKVKGMVY